ncbi:hypothetical protein O6P43_032322 [Quillaja saponaria]|uniref:Uncharacterized protein n=1 Tax=Quillaja saponaria TaxID=32244 RepID=A0AAD7KMT1_QUISA|nr:hypothetical protein O6P43_032322 [Quillaja saponaria]
MLGEASEGDELLKGFVQGFSFTSNNYYSNRDGLLHSSHESRTRLGSNIKGVWILVINQNKKNKIKIQY